MFFFIVLASGHTLTNGQTKSKICVKYTRVRNRFSAQVISEINFNKLFFVPIINKK